MITTEPIYRRTRIAQAIENFKPKGPFSTKDEVLECFIALFDEVELSVKEHNSKVTSGSMETVYMSVPSPVQHMRYKGLYYSIATKHVMFFTAWGAFALYRSIEHENGLEVYHNNELCLPLYEKVGACGRGVWDFEGITPLKTKQHESL